MRLDGIAVGDIIKTSIGGRVLYGEVLEIRAGMVYFNPISVGSGWRHASAHQVIAHADRPAQDLQPRSTRTASFSRRNS